MTISDSKKILDAIPGSKFNVPVEILGGLKVAIDISILLYKFSFMNGKSETNKITITNLDVKKESFGKVIAGIINKLTYSFIEKKIMPIIVFDGPAHKCKKNVIDERKSRKSKVKEEIKELKKEIKSCTETDALDETRAEELLEKLKKKSSTLIELTSENIEDLKNALDSCGIPHIEAENDAEKLCVILNKKGIVDCVYTSDFDAVVFGASAIITSIENGIASIIIPELIYLGSNLTRNQFVDFCILLGCDYNTRVKGFGPVKSYKSIIKYKNIETIISEDINDLIKKGKLSDNDVTIINLDFCRNEFLNPETNIDLESYNFDFRRPEGDFNIDKLIKFYNYISSSNEEKKSMIRIIEEHLGKMIIEEEDGKILSEFVNSNDLSSKLIKERTTRTKEINTEEKPKRLYKKKTKNESDKEEITESKEEKPSKLTRKRKTKVIE